MKKQKKNYLDFEVDKLTNSIENVVSGDSFSTDITLITNADLKTVTKKNGWQFDWKLELKQPARDVYKLTIVNNQSVIQGLISLEVKLTMFTCIWLKVRLSIKAKQKYMQVFRVTYLRLRANSHFNVGTMEMFRLFPKHNLFNITSIL